MHSKDSLPMGCLKKRSQCRFCGKNHVHFNGFINMQECRIWNSQTKVSETFLKKNIISGLYLYLPSVSLKSTSHDFCDHLTTNKCRNF